MPVSSPSVRAGRVAVRGRARVTVRDRHGRILRRRLFRNLETQYGLNALATWLVGGAGVVAPAAPSYIALGIGPVNLLAAAAADFETTPTGWAAISNCSVAQSSAQAWHDLYSLALTASSAASMSAGTATGTAGVAVTAGYQYSANAHVRAAASARQVGVNIAWYDSTGTLLSTSTGTTSADSTTGWTRVGVVATAPTSAAYAAVQVAVNSPSNGEVHYVDGAQFAYAPDGPMPWQEGYTGSAWAAVTPATTDTALSQERYLCRAQVDAGYTQQALAVLLHTFQQTDPTGYFTEAGLWDSATNSAGYLSSSAVAGDTALTVAGSTPAVAAGTQIYIPPAPLPTPGAPAFSGASATGGYLVGGQTYYYKITAVDSYGETLPGTEASYTAPGTNSTNQITLTWTAVPGAAGYKIYRGTSSGGELLLATMNPSTVLSYVDNTNTAPSGNPPTVDTSGSRGEYATIAAAAAAGATSWSLTDQLLYPHPARQTIGTTVINAPVVAMLGNLWAHVALTGISKTGTQLLTVQWEIDIQNAS